MSVWSFALQHRLSTSFTFFPLPPSALFQYPCGRIGDGVGRQTEVGQNFIIARGAQPEAVFDTYQFHRRVGDGPQGFQHGRAQAADEVVLLGHHDRGYTRHRSDERLRIERLERADVVNARLDALCRQERGRHRRQRDEGGYAPALKANSEALEVILEAIEKAGFKAGRGQQVAIALDPAASELYEEDTKLYNLRKEGKKLTGEQMVEFWAKWVKDYPIVSIEDGLAQNDWASWKVMTETLGDKVQIVGDDLLVTNPDRCIPVLPDRYWRNCPLHGT